MEMEPDRISNLPESIIEQIFSHLPIRDAMRTSLLSSKWRYKWAMVPCLVFDNSFFSSFSSENAFNGNKAVSIIDQVLLLHFGPLHKFGLFDREGLIQLDPSAIYRWILHLSRTSIKEIILRMPKGCSVAPSCLFSCQSLTNLELTSCALKPPSTFKGLRNLKSLLLVCVHLAQDGFENLMSSCPVLEKLSLLRVIGLSHININAPNLQVFCVSSVNNVISFENTTRLAEVIVCGYITTAANHSGDHRNSSNLLKFLIQLPHVRRLDIHYKFLKYLAGGFEPKRKLPKPCVDLDYLSIDMHLNNREECLIALCLLSSAPNLQELQISVYPDKVSAAATETNFWEDDCWNCPFTKLKIVKIIDIRGTQPELDFVKFMLSKAPVLERMVVYGLLVLPEEKLELVKKFLRFRRASERAEIIWLDK